MPADDQGARPAPVVLRIKLRYDDVETMVQRFAPNVGKSGLFLPTKSLQPIGTEIKFELRIANDTPVLVGLGRVKAVKVVAGETVEMPFGPPYKPVVTSYQSVDAKQKPVTQLSLSLIGSAGENCTNMTVTGDRPPKPTFTITDTEGKVVQSGSFEYG